MAENEKELVPDPETETTEKASEATRSESKTAGESPQAVPNDPTAEAADEIVSEVTFVSLADVKAEAEVSKEEKKPPVLRAEMIFDPIDVSEPRTPRKESEILEEEAALRRQNWVKSHLTLIFAAIGIVVVALTVVFILLYHRNANPVSRFASAFAKDFGTSFAFDVKMVQNEKPVMSFLGSIDSNRAEHTIDARYEADYVDYQYTGAVLTEGRKSTRGSFYQDKWTAYDCTERVQDFFEFDRSLSSGAFNGGAFLRFTGMTTNYESHEFESFVNDLMKRMTTNSPLATVTSSRDGDGTHYLYQINLNELFSMLKKDGAPVFYRSTDYDEFVRIYEENQHVLEASKCEFSYTITDAGYLSALDLTISAGEDNYGISCRMSDFGSAEVEIPDGFIKTAALENEKK